MKRTICLTLLMVLLLTPSAFANTLVKVNGNYMQSDTPPIIRNDRVLVPLRTIFEALDASVEWDSTTRTVTAQKGVTLISLQIGNKNASINNQSKTTDVAPIIHNNRTMVPLRFVSESLGEPVFWDEINRTAIVGNEKLYKSDGTLLYEGPVVNGRLTGEGKLYQNNEVIYKGNFENNKPQGKGVLYDRTQPTPIAIPVEINKDTIRQVSEPITPPTIPEATPITSSTNNQLLYPDGLLLYEGELSATNKPHGYGKLFGTNGNMLYEGNLANGIMSGQGTLYHNGQIIYRGQFSNNKFNGTGVLYKDGEAIYQGQFVNGEIQGGE